MLNVWNDADDGMGYHGSPLEKGDFPSLGGGRAPAPSGGLLVSGSCLHVRAGWRLTAGGVRNVVTLSICYHEGVDAKDKALDFSLCSYPNPQELWVLLSAVQ